MWVYFWEMRQHRYILCCLFRNWVTGAQRQITSRHWKKWCVGGIGHDVSIIYIEGFGLQSSSKDCILCDYLQLIHSQWKLKFAPCCWEIGVAWLNCGNEICTYLDSAKWGLTVSRHLQITSLICMAMYVIRHQGKSCWMKRKKYSIFMGKLDFCFVFCFFE